MSRFSGKCDLCDHINLLGNSDDEMENFLKFKEKNHGVIYQNMEFHINKNNIQDELKNNPYLEVISTQKQIKDKRTKTGYRTIEKTQYKYMNKIYNSLKELDKVYSNSRRKEIKIDTILDIIPYYPYIIGIQYSTADQEVTIISNRSYVDTEQERMLNNGHHSKICDYYRKELNEHYKDIVLKYYGK